MYMSATWRQVTNKFFAGLERFRERRMFAGWQWLESEETAYSGLNTAPSGSPMRAIR